MSYRAMNPCTLDQARALLDEGPWLLVEPSIGPDEHYPAVHTDTLEPSGKPENSWAIVHSMDGRLFCRFSEGTSNPRAMVTEEGVFLELVDEDGDEVLLVRRVPEQSRRLHRNLRQATENHGEAEGANTQIGDLEDLLELTIGLLGEHQRQLLVAHPRFVRLAASWLLKPASLLETPEPDEDAL